MSFEIEIPETYKDTFTIPLEFILKRYIIVKNTGGKLIRLCVTAKTLEIPEATHAEPTLFPQALSEFGRSEGFCYPTSTQKNQNLSGSSSMSREYGLKTYSTPQDTSYKTGKTQNS